MPIMDVTVHGKIYKISCEAGQEAHLQSLAKRLSTRVEKLSASLAANVPETTLLMLAGLMVEDELDNTMHDSNDNKESVVKANIALSEAIIGVADYIETIAENLEKA